ncbi:MAG: C-GCAxxG-C-C family protein [Desulfovibrionaceae bacterium]
MDPVDHAVECINNGMSCAQAMLAAFGPVYGLERGLAVRLGSGLGSGLGRSGGICGAVNGGCILLGLALGCDDPKDRAARARTYQAVAEFLERFAARRGSTLCRDILAAEGCPPPGQKPDKAALARMRGLCPAVVRDAAECLAALLPAPTAG